MGKHKYYFYVSMILLFFFIKIKKEKNFHLIPYCFTNQNISSACHNNKNNFKVLPSSGYIWFCHPFIVRYFSSARKKKNNWLSYIYENHPLHLNKKKNRNELYF